MDLIVDKNIILLIGGPGTGKTTLINELAKKGFTCLPEISRQVTLEAKSKGIDQLFLSQPLLFSEMLLKGRIAQFEQALEDKSEVVFIDRGIPDVLAYMHYIGDTYPEFFHEASSRYKYSKIFILPIWQDIYTCDNERYEDFEQAQKIQEHLIKTYHDYGYDLIEVPKESVENRVAFILNHL